MVGCLLSLIEGVGKLGIEVYHENSYWGLTHIASNSEAIMNYLLYP